MQMYYLEFIDALCYIAELANMLPLNLPSALNKNYEDIFSKE